MPSSSEVLLTRARQCLALEAAALEATARSLDESFPAVVRLLLERLEAGGRLLFTGIGKNVPIAQKLAGTFNSTGVPATFLDPGQAVHGDLGLAREGDLAFFLSYRGETEDLVRLVPYVRRLGVKTVAVTGFADSALAQACEALLTFQVDREACPLGLAPTASTTATLALGDALAMVALEERGFSRQDFAQYHPGGSLGKSLLLRVRDIMRQGDQMPALPVSTPVREALLGMTKARCGIAAVVDEAGKLVGVFTDGDFRRASLQDEFVLQRPLELFMTKEPIRIADDAMAVDALTVLEKHHIDDLLVVDKEGCPLGIVDGQDLPRLHLV